MLEALKKTPRKTSSHDGQLPAKIHNCEPDVLSFVNPRSLKKCSESSPNDGYKAQIPFGECSVSAPPNFVSCDKTRSIRTPALMR
jgi:hypothetical protein